MNVSFSKPVLAALARTRTILFDGFDPLKYLILGFAACLGGLADGCTPSYGTRFNAPDVRDLDDIGGMDALGLVFGDLGGLLGMFLIVGLAFYLLFLWLSANGSFVLLDGIVHDRGALIEPWGRLQRQSNRFFLGSVAFGVLSYGLVAAISIPGLIVLHQLVRSDGWMAGAGFLGSVMLGLVLGFVGLALLYLWLLARHFVLPLMYRDRTGFRRACSKFLRLWWRHPGDFLLYALLIGLIHVGLLLILGALVIATCCVAGLVLMIPYLNTLFLLPVLVFLRLLSLEFLAQFGDEYRIDLIVADDEPPASPIVPAT